MLKLGINVNPLQGFTAQETADLHVRYVRFPLWDNELDFYIEYSKELLALGMQPIYVMDSRTWKDWPDTSDWRLLPGRFFQMGNEPDIVSPSSFTQPSESFSADLTWAREWLGKKKYIIAGGLASGNPSFLDGVSLKPVNAIAIHPYGQRSSQDFPSQGWGVGDVWDLTAAYKRFKKPIWITEFGGPIAEFASREQRSEYVSQMLDHFNREHLVAGIYFCYSDDMAEGFGLDEEIISLLR